MKIKILLFTIIFSGLFGLAESSQAATINVNASSLQGILPRYERANNYGDILGSGDERTFSAIINLRG